MYRKIRKRFLIIIISFVILWQLTSVYFVLAETFTKNAYGDNQSNYDRLCWQYTPSVKNPAIPDWSEYDFFLDCAQKETNVEKRAEFLHKAENMLMETGAVIPLFEYRERYFQGLGITGICTDPFAFDSFRDAITASGKATVYLGGEPAGVDPGIQAFINTNTGSLIKNLFEGLYRYTYDGEIVPGICDPERPFDLSEDQCMYTFHLRDNLKWSDGSPLSARDIEYEWKRVANTYTGFYYCDLFESFEMNKYGQIDVKSSEDGKSFIVRLKHPCPYFLELCAHPALAPVPQEKAQKYCVDVDKSKWCRDAGFPCNGAYVVKEWDHISKLVLEKNNNYYLPGEASVDEITVFLNEDDAIAAGIAGKLDYATNLQNSKWEILEGKKEALYHERKGTCLLTYNVGSTMFQEKTMEQSIAIRKALALLLDREYVVKVLCQGEASATTSLISDGKGYYEYVRTDNYRDIKEEAIHLLEEAGFSFTRENRLSEDTPLTVRLLSYDYSFYLQIGKAFQKDLAMIGIDLILETGEANYVSKCVKEGDYDLFFFDCYENVEDPEMILSYFRGKSEKNYTGLGK